MTISQSTEQISASLIKKFEGLSLKAYRDSAGIWTIGYGNTSYLKSFPIKETITITQEKAEELFMNDLIPCIASVKNCVTQQLKPNQYAALVSFVFNLGCEALKKSSLLRVINETPNNFDVIKPHWLEWNKITVNGVKVVCEGLSKRREEEVGVYCS